MGAHFKHAIVLTVALTIGSLAICFGVMGSLNAFIPAIPEAATVPIDSAAAARLDEDLDYRIAQQTRSLEGWRAFLDAHKNGAHEPSARAAVEKLLGRTAPAQPTAEASNGASPDAIPRNSDANSDVAVAQPPPQTDAAMLTSGEICKRDEERLDRLRNSAARDDVAQFANELQCEALRPQVVGLMESLDHPAASSPTAPELATGASEGAPAESASRDATAGSRAAVSATQSPETASSAPLSPETKVAALDSAIPAIALAPPLPPVKSISAPRRNSQPAVTPGKARAAPSATRRVQQRRHANRCTFKFLCFRKGPAVPPILLAIMGEKPKKPISSHDR